MTRASYGCGGFIWRRRRWGFRHNGQVVFQFQLARDQAAVPLTRDYLYHDVAPAQMHHAAE